MTFEVQQNRWDQTIRRVSGSIGPGSRVAETLAELFPVFDVENLPGELMFLSGSKLGMASGRLTQSVGNTSKIQLFNPADSGHIVTVTTVLITTNATTQLRATVSEGALDDDAGGSQLRDTRLGVSVPALAQLRTEQTVTGVTQTWVWRIQGSRPLIIQDENSVAVLAPGTGWTVSTVAFDLELNACFFWRERPAIESELNF